MIVKTRAIVLHSFTFGDSSIIVDVFTESNGRMSFIVHISKSSKQKVKRQLFQPMSLLEIEFNFRANIKLQHLGEAHFYYSPYTIPFNPIKLSLLLFLSEFLYYSLRKEQTNYPLFLYVENSIKWLDMCPNKFSNFHLVFLIRLSKFLGFFPNIDSYAVGSYFDLRNGCFCSVRPQHNDYLEVGESDKVIKLMRMDYRTMHLYTMSRLDRDRCIEVLLKYYKLHIPEFPELKSLSVLKELFA